MKHPIPALTLIALTFSATPLRAEDKPAPAPAAPATPAAADKIYAPKDLAALRALKGQTVKIEGTILKQGESKTGASVISWNPLTLSVGLARGMV